MPCVSSIRKINIVKGHLEDEEVKENVIVSHNLKLKKTNSISQKALKGLLHIL